MASLITRRIIFGLAIGTIAVLLGYLTSAFWDILTTEQRVELGVFLATAGSVIAYIAFTFWDNHLERPDLVLLHDSNIPDIFTPQLIIFFDNNIQREIRFLRVLVRNRGSRTAERCLARLQLIQRPPGSHTLSREQKTLIWPDVPEFPNIPPKAEFAVNIAYSARDFTLPQPGACDGNVRAWVCTREALSVPNIRAQDALCLGEFRLRLSVYSDNSSPVHRELVLNVRENWHDLNMQFVDD